MKKIPFFVVLAAMLASCGSNLEPLKTNRLNVTCENCLVDFANSLSVDLETNEMARFVLTADEGYLLPTDIKVTSGNQVFVKNVDYAYLIDEDRLSGEIMVKATKAIDIIVEADEQGYLFIGENKISKSGDYSEFDLSAQGDSDDGKIVYDHKTNTLTLTNSSIALEKVGFTDYTVPFETEEATFSSLIGWTGGGTLNIRFNGLINIFGSEKNDHDCAFICPFSDGTLNIIGPGVAHFYELDEGIVVNGRGRTSIKDVCFESKDLGEFALASRELDIDGCDLQFVSGVPFGDSVGVYANDLTMMNSHVSSNGFVVGVKAAQLVLIDSFFETSSLATGVLTDWLYTYGHVENDNYTTKIYATAPNFGVSTYDAMELTNTEIKAIATSDINGHALITVDSEIIANNCDIYAHSMVGQAVHAHYLELTNCNVKAISDDGIGILTSIRGAQPTSREYEPILDFDNCNVEAYGSDVAIYGFGHAVFTNCNDLPKYLEKELSEELQLYMWALVDESVTEIQYDGGFDPESGAPNFVPTNALKEVQIKAAL
ncbi:MAG: hypothetical protein MJ239_03075 [Bacilli bacterium]|nr:hypothetical protein [Bacilli bacterium]